MTRRQDIILNELRVFGPSSVDWLASVTYAPSASVRRDIQALRQRGFDIKATTPNSRYSRYVLRGR